MTLLFVAAASLASAQSVIFTIWATAQDNDHGYVAGNSYSFVFTVNGSYADNGESGIIGVYQAQTISEPDFITSISGSGVQGTYVTPGGAYHWYNGLTNYAASGMPEWNFLVQSVNGSEQERGSIGVQTLDATSLVRIEASLNDNVLPDFTTRSNNFDPVYQTPASYYTNGTSIVGTYSGFTSSPYNAVTLEWADGTMSTKFDVTSFNIAVTAIPEPSTYAMLFGVAAIGFVSWHRRFRRAVKSEDVLA